MRLASVAAFAALAAACTGFRQEANGVFRAPQTGEEATARRIAAHGIRTVVCLRGDGPESAPSARAALAAGAAFVRVPMSATQRPAPATLLTLWDVAATAERPLLLHCRAGVDRTGLASAILALHDSGDLAAARAQLAFVPYGHVAWSATGAMDEVLDRYAPYHGRMEFPAWVVDVYASTWQEAGR